MDTTPTLANAVMAIQGTNSFPDYEQRLIDAFLTAEEKFKILDDHGENEAIPSSLDAEPGPFVAEDEVTPGSIELEVKEGPWLAKVGPASCSFKEQAEDTDAHVGRIDLVVQKDALTSSSSAVTQLGQAQASVNSETPHPSQANNHKAPLIIVRSVRDYQKRGIEEHEVVEAAKRVSQIFSGLRTAFLGSVAKALGAVDQSERTSHPCLKLRCCFDVWGNS